MSLSECNFSSIVVKYFGNHHIHYHLHKDLNFFNYFRIVFAELSSLPNSDKIL